ncbi:MAG: EcoRV family type II restriction endonuclease, partial [Thaumarchaeota archaeon]|nr:EcoRV family type II restriction endonuclease [Nitrososphaerota archaeon]
MKVNTHLNSMGSKAFAVSVIVVFLGLGLLGVRITSATTSQSYNNVQIFVSPQNSTLDSFSISAYNSTGGLVASSQSSYPAFSFELPSGTYLFTVSASSTYSYPIGGPITYGASQSSAPNIAYPYKYYNPTEYGYVLTDVTASKTINIATQQIQNMSTSKISISAKYLNGTSAVGAYIDASIVGGGYYYYPNSNVMMSGQTGSDGTVTLEVPSVPLEITAWSWIQVNLPQNETTTKVNIGGESV